MMNKLMYEVLGSQKGNAVVETYRETLKSLSPELTIEKNNEDMSTVILNLFSDEVKRYCNRTFSIEEWVVGNIVADLQTYHYL